MWRFSEGKLPEGICPKFINLLDKIFFRCETETETETENSLTSNSKMCTPSPGLQLDENKPILKEGMLYKRTGLFRLWKPRYFVLVDDSLNYFYNQTDGSDNRSAAGRVLLDQIKEFETKEGKKHIYNVFIGEKKGKKHLINYQSKEEREEWMEKIQGAKRSLKKVDIPNIESNTDKEVDRNIDASDHLADQSLDDLAKNNCEDTSNPDKDEKIEQSELSKPITPSQLPTVANRSSLSISDEEDSSAATSKRLGKGRKQVSIKKDPTHGIGCSIKFVGDALYVSRIVPESPIAKTGVLKPGDEIVEVNGLPVANTPLSKIKEALKETADEIVFDVKPLTLYGSNQNTNDQAPSSYTEVDPNIIKATFQSSEMMKIESSEQRKEIGKMESLERRVNDNLPNEGSVDSENDRSVSQSSDDASSQRKYVELDFKKR